MACEGTHGSGRAGVKAEALAKRGAEHQRGALTPDRPEPTTTKQATGGLRSGHSQHPIGRHRSAAPLENTAGLRLPVFLTVEPLERRLAPALMHYTAFRPHHGLHGATPAEAFLGLEPAIRRARRAPRGRPSEGTLEVAWQVGFLDEPEERFPVLVPIAA